MPGTHHCSAVCVDAEAGRAKLQPLAVVLFSKAHFGLPVSAVAASGPVRSAAPAVLYALSLLWQALLQFTECLSSPKCHPIILRHMQCAKCMSGQHLLVLCKC